MIKVCETEPSYSAKLLYKKLEHVRKCLYEKENSSKEVTAVLGTLSCFNEQDRKRKRRNYEESVEIGPTFVLI